MCSPQAAPSRYPPLRRPRKPPQASAEASKGLGWASLAPASSLRCGRLFPTGVSQGSGHSVGWWGCPRGLTPEGPSCPGWGRRQELAVQARQGPEGWSCMGRGGPARAGARARRAGLSLRPSWEASLGRRLSSLQGLLGRLSWGDPGQAWWAEGEG